jgi:hypothetical protein
MCFDRDIKTEVGCMMKLVRMVRCIPHDLLGDAANVYARSAQRAIFDNRRFRSVLGCTLRMRESAAATANNQKVVPLCHSFSPKCVLSRHQS